MTPGDSLRGRFKFSVFRLGFVGLFQFGDPVNHRIGQASRGWCGPEQRDYSAP